MARPGSPLFRKTQSASREISMTLRRQLTLTNPLRWVWPLILLVLACVAALPSNGQAPAPAAPPASAAQAAPAVPPREPANVMGWEHADWLEREGRAETEKP